MSPENEEMRPEYDIRGGERGKYFRQYHEGPLLHVVTTDWVQVQTTESMGRHRRCSTEWVGAEPAYVSLRPVVGRPILQ